MNNLLVHIGYHKTGTTWLQKELFSSESEFFIPVSNKKKGQNTLARSFIFNKDGYLLNSFSMNEKVIQKKLNRILKTSDFDGDKIPVISHERLSGNPHSSGFDSSIIARRIHKTFPKAKILIVIREQSSWILSNYFQYLSIGGNHGLKKYLNSQYDGKRPGFSPSHLEFHHLIKEYQNKFSKENVLVIPYEIFKTDIDLFLKTLGAFLKKDICTSTQVNSEKIYNAKSNHFINYKLRFLNPFIRQSSVNNYSALYNSISSSVASRIKIFLGQCLPSKFDESIQASLLKEIEQWAIGRFNKSNSITQKLIHFNLKDLGYETVSINKSV